jgi:hypothetical protein
MIRSEMRPCTLFIFVDNYAGFVEIIAIQATISEN